LVKKTPVAEDGPAFDKVMAKVTLLPAKTGFGDAVCETDRSAAELTTIVAPLVLLAMLKSGSLAVAMMVLVKVPIEFGLATRLMVAMPLLVTEPRLKVAPLLEEVNEPWLVNADTKENVGGSAFVRITPVAVDGPTFVRTMVNVTLLLRTAGFEEAVCETDRSATGVTTTVA
jgi:hypothetical protein